MKIIKNISVAIKNIWILFFILIVLLFFSLRSGINISSLNLYALKFEELYIKLDKKLILSVKNLKISFKKKHSNSTTDLENAFKKLPYLDKFCQIISIQNIEVDGYHSKILYKDNVFYLDTKYLTLNTDIKKIDNTLKININEILLKDFDLKLSGKAFLETKSKDIKFEGFFNTYGIDGNISIRTNKDLLFYKVSTSAFQDLDNFMDNLLKKIELDKEISDWIYKNSKAKSYELKNLEGKINTKTWNYYPYEMRANALLKDVEVTFHKDVKPATTEQMKIMLKNNNLYFEPLKPTFDGISIKTPEISIYNLLKSKTGIIINIVGTSKLDEKIHNILKAFEINIPVFQHSGKTITDLTLNIKFVPFDINVKGNFNVIDSNISIEEVPFYSKNANITLDNTNLIFKDLNLQYQNLFDFDINGTLNIENGKFNGNLNTNKFQIGKKENKILDIKNLTSELEFLINENEFKGKIPAFFTELNFKKNNYSIEQKNLKSLIPYSAFAKNIGIKDGSFVLKTSDFSKFLVDLNITDMQTAIFENNESLQKEYFKILYENDIIFAKTNDDRILITHKEDSTKIKLKDLNLVIEDKNIDSKEKNKINLNGENSKILFKDLNRTLIFDKYEIDLNFDLSKLNARKGKAKLNFAHSNNILSLKAKDFDSNFTNEIIKKNIFEGGRFDLNLKGNNFNCYDGNMSFYNTRLQKFSFYHQILELINSIPSLIFLKGTDFSQNGFKIKNGEIIFSKQDNNISIKALMLQGSSSIIAGFGNIDLINNTIDMNLELRTLKDISKIIDKIPLINHILLGKNESISLSMSIKGNLQNPKIQTHFLKDMAMSPINIIRRTLEAPFILFMDKNGSNP